MAELDIRQAALRDDLVARLYVQLSEVPLTGKEGDEARNLYNTDPGAAREYEAKIYAQRALRAAEIVLAEVYPRLGATE